MTIRTQLRAGGRLRNHSETLSVRSALKAGAFVRNHNEALRQKAEGNAISMRRQPLTTVRKEDRLELLVIRAGLRAGARRRAWARK